MAGEDGIHTCYVCTYAICEKWGGQVLLEGLAERLAGDVCRVKRYLCFGACAMGPNIVLLPKGTWYTDVQPADLDDIAAHIQGGQPVTRLTREVDADTLRMALWMVDDD